MPTARSSSHGAVQLAMPNVVDISPFRSFHSAAQQSIPSIPGGNSRSLGHNPGPNCFAPQVLQAGDPLLSKRAVEVALDAIGSCAIEKVINDLVAAMRNLGASALSAPQIGQALQIIVLEDPTIQQPSKLMVIINPKLVVIHPEETETSLEECPSVCGYCALVERFSRVKATGLNRRGEKIQIDAKGWLARALQHESDHLEGILFVDKMVPKSFRSIS
ncbi:peptide deformylase 1A, chloroplastic-like [Selaginella moellendorffii]|uniref:peptide deformylase 1A, chloroplastic-like n=1 Tax=Selaginella moellendorffii TaxID=88036 RepID=UPI000D1CDB9E|nr:peptide deformylase 1A, chloroplastic-like [Selaginella moellendorffii]|eukprot:XP_024533637.1 peptide deformylase 1A, chloroplastic-like [Selaginella moellendorffii]